MIQKIKYMPPVCLLVSLFRILTGRLKFSADFPGCSIKLEDGSEFTIFRQITKTRENLSINGCVFIVRFKFRKLSHKANKIVSIIPMLLIAGHPGFISKCYAINHKNGYWMGMYQWKSEKYLRAYKKSFVFRMMNKRAIAETIRLDELSNKNLKKVIENIIVT